MFKNFFLLIKYQYLHYLVIETCKFSIHLTHFSSSLVYFNSILLNFHETLFAHWTFFLCNMINLGSCSPCQLLCDGFWPYAQITPSIVDEFMTNGKEIEAIEESCTWFYLWTLVMTLDENKLVSYLLCQFGLHMHMQFHIGFRPKAKEINLLILCKQSTWKTF